MEDNTLEFMDTRGHNFYKENLESQIAELTKERDELKKAWEDSEFVATFNFKSQSKQISDLKAQIVEAENLMSESYEKLMMCRPFVAGLGPITFKLKQFKLKKAEGSKEG